MTNLDRTTVCCPNPGCRRWFNAPSRALPCPHCGSLPPPRLVGRWETWYVVGLAVLGLACLVAFNPLTFAGPGEMFLVPLGALAVVVALGGFALAATFLFREPDVPRDPLYTRFREQPEERPAPPAAVPCPHCHGTGRFPVPLPGRGDVFERPCQWCLGTGTVQRGRAG